LSAYAECPFPEISYGVWVKAAPGVNLSAEKRIKKPGYAGRKGETLFYGL